MKTFRQYLVESVRTYRYTLKIAGDVDSKFLDLLRMNLKKFDPVKIEDAKTTPIQKDPYGFPDIHNESVTIIKCEFKYPATEPMIQQMVQLMGKNVNQVRLITTDYDDSVNHEVEQYANEASHSPLLLHTELEDDGKEANKDYANQYLDKVVPKKPTFDYQYAAKRTPDSPNKTKEGIQTQSPMTNVNRPSKPATGASFNK
jgi:hypothetical protein